MQQRRDELDELARGRLGRQFRGERDSDLALLQELLDRRLVTASDTAQLQGMGIILGDMIRHTTDG